MAVKKSNSIYRNIALFEEDWSKFDGKQKKYGKNCINFSRADLIRHLMHIDDLWCEENETKDTPKENHAESTLEKMQILKEENMSLREQIKNQQQILNDLNLALSKTQSEIQAYRDNETKLRNELNTIIHERDEAIAKTQEYATIIDEREQEFYCWANTKIENHINVIKQLLKINQSFEKKPKESFFSFFKSFLWILFPSTAILLDGSLTKL